MTNPWSWTQPACPACYAIRYPHVPISQRAESETRTKEPCVFCGQDTADAIDVKIDPVTPGLHQSRRA